MTHYKFTASLKHLLFAGLLVFLASSCANFARLNKDLEKQEGLSRVSGEIFEGEWSGGPVKVYLFEIVESEKFPYRLREVQVQPRPSRYEFIVEQPGRYLIGALEDKNGDARIDEGETIGVVNHFLPIDLRQRQILTDQNMELSTEIPPRVAKLESSEIQLEDTLHHGSIAKLSAEKFSEEIGLLGMWQPFTFLQEYSSGIYMLQPFEPNKAVVLFVHGIADGPQSFEPLVAKLDRSRYQPWIFHYPSGLRLDVIAGGFASALELTLYPLDAEGQGPEIYLVAHSMGGLVSHRALRNHYSLPGKHHLKCLITIASPLDGMASADAGVEYAPSVVPSWRDVASKSRFVETLLSPALPDSVPYFLYFAYGGSSMLGGEAGDGTVLLSSQLRPAAQRVAAGIMGFNATHTGILKLDALSVQLAKDLSACQKFPTQRKPKTLQ